MNNQNRFVVVVESPLWKKTKTSVQTKSYKRTRYRGAVSKLVSAFLCYQDRKGLTPGGKESVLQPTGLNPIIEIRHSRSSSWTHLKVASRTKISWQKLGEHCLSPFSQSGCPSNSYPSALTHTYGTSPPPLIPAYPCNPSTSSIHFKVHITFTGLRIYFSSLRINCVPDSWSNSINMLLLPIFFYIYL